MKIGILGGTFNPIHIGHLILADEVRQKLQLDKIFFVPVYLPPHKEERDLAPACDRFNMVRLAMKSNEAFEIKDIELKRRGKSYTVETLKCLKNQYPSNYKFYFILGSDGLSFIDEWKDIQESMKLAKFVAAGRPGFPLKNIPGNILPLVIDSIDISAFKIRQKIKNGESVRYYLPAQVFDYILKKGLYKK